MKSPMNKETFQPKRANIPATSGSDSDFDEIETREGGADRGGNVDKIRDILFGREMRDYDKKFSRVEERLLKETADLREDLKRRFAAIETYMKSELTALSDRQKADQVAHAEAIKELSRELKEHAKSSEKKSAQLEEQAAKAQRELRQNILDESKRFTDEIEQKSRDLTALVEREVQDLRVSLTDRLALADLFAEVSIRLKNGGGDEKR